MSGHLCLLVTLTLVSQSAAADYSIADLLNDVTTVAPDKSAGTPSPNKNEGGAQGTQGTQQQIGSLLSSLDSSKTATNGSNTGSSFTVSPQSDSGDFSHLSLTASSRDIVSGLVEGFMNKAQLEEGEKECLVNHLGQFTGSVMGIGRDAVNAVRGFMQKNASHTSLIPLLIDAAMKVTSLVATSTGLLRNCVQGDALKVLNATAHNLANWSYISNRLVVSGVDIAHCFASSIVAFETKDFKKFGSEIGTALRKVLLSTSNNGTRLPEGYPKEAIIGDVTDGLMSGFFADGMTIRVRDKHAGDPKIDINIDLHKCITDNQQIWRTAWKGVWDLVASIAANREQHGLAAAQQQRVLQAATDATASPAPSWTGELMMALVQLPGALATCGIDEAMEKMMVDAVKALNHLSVTWAFPDDRIQANTAAESVGRAVAAWTSNDFKTFGQELGKLLREFILLAFPAKYSVDSAGRLQRNMESPSLADRLSQPQLGPVPLFPAVVAISAALVVLLGVVIIARRSRGTVRAPQLCAHEEDEDLEVVE